MSKVYPTFADAHADLVRQMRSLSKRVHPGHWQGLDVSQKPEMATRELFDVSISVPMTGTRDELRQTIAPNLPWADEHFVERISGIPSNPGESWKRWPYAKSAARFLDAKFTHTYMERFWPKYAGYNPDDGPSMPPNEGTRYVLGDLNDVIALLDRDPLTRQAYLPIFFPEDTGAVHGGRIPCSIGYHFILRGGFLHCVYQLRSCDLVRHFRDDVYLAVRLVQHVLESVAAINETWKLVSIGRLTMHMTSLHIFEADARRVLGE